MNWLLDTSTLSEYRRSRPDARVLAWTESVRSESLFLSVLVVGELWRGVAQLRRRDPAQADGLQAWVTGALRSYGERVLPVTEEVAVEWAQMTVPDPLPTIDGLLAATARVHGLTVVTRNVKDFERAGVPVLNPFTFEG